MAGGDDTAFPDLFQIDGGDHAAGTASLAQTDGAPRTLPAPAMPHAPKGIAHAAASICPPSIAMSFTGGNEFGFRGMGAGRAGIEAGESVREEHGACCGTVAPIGFGPNMPGHAGPRAPPRRRSDMRK